MAKLIGTESADTLNGTGSDDTIYGLAGDDQLDGLTGDDRLLGGAGADLLAGGPGNDTYYFESDDLFEDTITENLSEGVDTLKVLPDNEVFDDYVDLGFFENVENLSLRDNTDFYNGSGNELNNKILGSNAENYLDGFTGNDSLYGYAGNDILVGREGNDRLVGDIGSDLLAGGPGDDILILGNNSRESSYEDSDSDEVYYFNGEGTDKIYGFVPGSGGDFILFGGIENIDVVRDGIDTKFYDYDTGNLLVTLRRTTGLTEADVGVNLFSEGNFAF